jgi:DNA-binding transcriptional LysR family regulator
VQSVRVHSDEIKLLVPPIHPLASRPQVDCRDLVEYPLLLPKSGTTRVRLNTWLEMVEDLIHISMELESTEMIKRFVIAGLGVSFLAASPAAEVEAETGGRPLGLEPMVRHVGLIYRKDRRGPGRR